MFEIGGLTASAGVLDGETGDRRGRAQIDLQAVPAPAVVEHHLSVVPRVQLPLVALSGPSVSEQAATVAVVGVEHGQVAGDGRRSGCGGVVDRTVQVVGGGRDGVQAQDGSTAWAPVRPGRKCRWYGPGGGDRWWVPGRVVHSDAAAHPRWFDPVIVALFPDGCPSRCAGGAAHRVGDGGEPPAGS